MEEEEQAGLEILLKQRLVRPSYTRFISEEFSEAANHQPQKTHKDGNRHTARTGWSEPGDGGHLAQDTTSMSACQTVTLESDSDSEYLSAAEEIDSNTDNEDSESASASSPEKKGITMGQVQEKRTRCKKQRKRQRRRLRSECLENLPFTSEEFMEEEGPLCSDDLRRNNPHVPTLTKLCLQSYCKHRTKAGPFPPGLNRAVKAEISNKIQRSALIEWLSRFLDFQESIVAEDVRTAKENTRSSVWYPDHHGKVRATEESKLKGKQDIYHHRQSGSIWFGSSRREINYHLRDTENYKEREFTKNFGHLLDQIERGNYHMTTISNSNGLSALARLIDLLLPKAFAQSPVSNKELNKRQTTACIRVKALLLKRYPNLVYYMFWEAVPYVWWLRGNPAEAEEAFLHLIQDTAIIKTDAQKAVYINELARMYLHFGKYAKAIKTFASAMEVTDPVCRPLVDLQTHVLTAACLDTGILTQSHSSAAIAAWDRVIGKETGDLFYLSVDAAITSVMCHHAGIAFDRNTWSWKESACVWLRSHATRLPQTQLSLSLIHAMEGEERDSVKAFRMYTDGYSMTMAVGELYGHLPGMGWTNPDVSQVGARQTPFSAIVKQVELQGCPINPMRTIWRRKLCHFTLDDERRWTVGDDDHPSCKLWLTEDGLLACDVHLTLPPLPQVLLHPLTGEIQFAESSLSVPVCHLSVPPPLSEYRTPRTHRLYEDDRVTVDLNEWMTKLPRGSYSTKTYITRKEAEGEVAELNLKRLIRDHVVQMTKKKIHGEAARLPEAERSTFINGLLGKLEKAIKNGLNPTYKSIEMMERPVGNPTKAKAGKTKGNVKNRSVKQDLFGPRLIAQNSFPGSIALLYELDNQEWQDHNTRNASVAVIIRFEDREKFLTPILFSNEDGYIFQQTTEKNGTGQLVCPKTFFMVSSNCGQDDSIVMGTSYFGTHQVLHRSGTDKRFVVYNLAGEQVRVLAKKSNHINQLKVAGDYLIHIDNDTHMMKIEPFDRRGRTEISLPGRVERTFVLMGNVFVMTTESLLMVDPIKSTILPWKMYNSSNSTLQADGTQLVLNHRLVLKLLKAERFSTGLSDLQGPVVRAIIGYGNHVLTIEVPDGSQGMDAVHCLLDIEVPGTPTEACFIQDKGSLLVTATIFHELDAAVYQENLYHYTHTGRLVSLLPSLGHGPHGLYLLYHPGSADLAEQYPDVPYKEPGWYIYLRDGHGAVMCARTECQ